MNEPFTQMAEGAAAAHEYFLSLVAAGFTEDQALRLIGVMMVENGRHQDPPQGGGR